MVGEERGISIKEGMADVEGTVEVERSGRVYKSKGVLEEVVVVSVVLGGVILIFLEESFVLSNWEGIGVTSMEVIGEGIGKGEVMGDVIIGWRGRTG